MQQRVGRLVHTTQVWGRTEQKRPAQLGRDLEFGAWYFEHQARRLQSNLGEAGRLIDHDLRRMPERAPVYTEETLRILYGKPERIEQNAIILFF